MMMHTQVQVQAQGMWPGRHGAQRWRVDTRHQGLHQNGVRPIMGISVGDTVELMTQMFEMSYLGLVSYYNLCSIL